MEWYKQIECKTGWPPAFLAIFALAVPPIAIAAAVLVYCIVSVFCG